MALQARSVEARLSGIGSCCTCTCRDEHAAARFPAATNRESPPRSGRLASAMPAHPLAESGARRAILAPRRQPKGTESRRRARALRSGSTEGSPDLRVVYLQEPAPEEFDGSRGRRSRLRGRRVAVALGHPNDAGRAARTSRQRFLSGASVVASVLETRMKRRRPPSSALIFDVACAVVPEPAKKSRTISSGRCLGEGCGPSN